jgi:hypothetical protein
MLEQLKNPQSSTDEHFRDNLVRMLFFTELTRLMVTLFQDTAVVKQHEYKQLRRFCKEVHTKLEWFRSTVRKMAGENGERIDEEITMDGDKVSNIAELADFIARNGDVSKEVVLLTSKSQRERLFFAAWKQSRVSLSDQMPMDTEAFKAWYLSEFPE